MLEGYSADQLNKLLSILKWVLGFLACFTASVGIFNQWLSDRVAYLQSRDKTVAQTRLKESQAELEATKNRTIELEKKLAPRQLTADMRKGLLEALSATGKGPIGVVHSGLVAETVNFTEELKAVLVDAGFTIASYENPLGYMIKAPAPWCVAIIVGEAVEMPRVVAIKEAFSRIGIDAMLTNGKEIAKPGEIKVYIGAK